MPVKRKAQKKKIRVEKQLEARVLTEDEKLWREQLPFLYDLMLRQNLHQPSPTVQWLPMVNAQEDENFNRYNMILGTQAEDLRDPNHLLLAHVKIPRDEKTINNNDDYDATQSGDGTAPSGDGTAQSSDGTAQGYDSTAIMERRFEVDALISHDGAVKQVRFLPQHPNIVATISHSRHVSLYDAVAQRSSVDSPNARCRPQFRLRGHRREMRSLSWNPNATGSLLGASDDETICLWDISALPATSRVLDPTSVYKGNRAGVNDVSWNALHQAIFASVSADRRLMLWDTRSKATNKAMYTIVDSHNAPINCVTFSPHQEELFMTGSSDRSMVLWDMRSLNSKLHTFHAHKDETFEVHWSPWNGSVVGSCGGGRRLHVWDLSRIGMKQTKEDAEDGPPEHLFIHGGHADRVADFSWHPTEPWLLCSVAMDKSVHVWQMAADIYADEKEDSESGPGQLRGMSL